MHLVDWKYELIAIEKRIVLSVKCQKIVTNAYCRFPESEAIPVHRSKNCKKVQRYLRSCDNHTFGILLDLKRKIDNPNYH